MVLIAVNDFIAIIFIVLGDTQNYIQESLVSVMYRSLQGA